MNYLRASLLFLVLLISGCATLAPSYEEPSLTVTSFKLLPAKGFEQPFAIGLKLINPNSTALNINGMSYQLKVEGHKLSQGVTRDIPLTPAYGESEFKVIVSTNLFSGLKLLQDVMQNPRDTVSYELVAKLDVGWTWLPKLTVTQAGQISLSQ